MFLDQEIDSIVSKFWQDVPEKDKSFPRNLESILWRLQITCVPLPDLDLQKVHWWLQTKKLILPDRVKGQTRQVFGCLVAARGKGYIFVDSKANSGEIRFTIAHETGHFLRDYLAPRQRAIEVLGSEITEVLDGNRQPTEIERVHAVLSCTQLYVYVDLLLRGPKNQILSNDTTQSETRADQIAFELLAPHKDVLMKAQVEPFSLPSDEIVRRIGPILLFAFGLPQSTTHEYAKRIANYYQRKENIRDWLGL